MRKSIIVLMAMALLLAFVTPAFAIDETRAITNGILRTYNRAAQSVSTGDVWLIAPIAGKRVYLYRINQTTSSTVAGTFTAKTVAAGGTTVHAVVGMVVNPGGGWMLPMMSANPHVEVSEPGAGVMVNVPAAANTTTWNYKFQQRR